METSTKNRMRKKSSNPSGLGNALFVFLVLLFFVLGSRLCFAETEEHPLFETFHLEFQTVFANFDTVLLLDVPGFEPIPIDLENELLFDESKVVTRFTAGGLIRGRHQISAAYSFANRANSLALADLIPGTGPALPISGAIDANLDTWFLEAYYTGFVVRRENVGLGIIGGIKVVSLDANISVPVLGLDEGITETIPAPVAGADLRFVIAPRVIARAETKFIFLHVNEIGGTSWDLNALLEFQVTDHFSIGGGYYWNSVFVEFDEEIISEVDYHYHGAQASVRIRL